MPGRIPGAPDDQQPDTSGGSDSGSDDEEEQTAAETYGSISRNRANPTGNDDDPSDPGGTSDDLGIPNSSISRTREDPTGNDDSGTSGGGSGGGSSGSSGSDSEPTAAETYGSISRNRANPTGNDDDPSDPGGTSDRYGTPNSSISRRRPSPTGDDNTSSTSPGSVRGGSTRDRDRTAAETYGSISRTREDPTINDDQGVEARDGFEYQEQARELEQRAIDELGLDSDDDVAIRFDEESEQLEAELTATGEFALQEQAEERARRRRNSWDNIPGVNEARRQTVDRRLDNIAGFEEAQNDARRAREGLNNPDEQFGDNAINIPEWVPGVGGQRVEDALDDGSDAFQTTVRRSADLRLEGYGPRGGAGDAVRTSVQAERAGLDAAEDAGFGDWAQTYRNVSGDGNSGVVEDASRSFYYGIGAGVDPFGAASDVKEVGETAVYAAEGNLDSEQVTEEVRERGSAAWENLESNPVEGSANIAGAITGGLVTGTAGAAGARGAVRATGVDVGDAAGTVRDTAQSARQTVREGTPDVSVVRDPDASTVDVTEEFRTGMRERANRARDQDLFDTDGWTDSVSERVTDFNRPGTPEVPNIRDAFEDARTRTRQEAINARFALAEVSQNVRGRGSGAGASSTRGGFESARDSLSDTAQNIRDAPPAFRESASDAASDIRQDFRNEATAARWDLAENVEGFRESFRTRGAEDILDEGQSTSRVDQARVAAASDISEAFERVRNAPRVARTQTELRLQSARDSAQSARGFDPRDYSLRVDAPESWDVDIDDSPSPSPSSSDLPFDIDDGRFGGLDSDDSPNADTDTADTDDFGSDNVFNDDEVDAGDQVLRMRSRSDSIDTTRTGTGTDTVPRDSGTNIFPGAGGVAFAFDEPEVESSTGLEDSGTTGGLFEDTWTDEGVFGDTDQAVGQDLDVGSFGGTDEATDLFNDNDLRTPTGTRIGTNTDTTTDLDIGTRTGTWTDTTTDEDERWRMGTPGGSGRGGGRPRWGWEPEEESSSSSTFDFGTDEDLFSSGIADAEDLWK